MTNLPPGWAWARLDEIAEVRLGRQRSPKNHSGTHMRPYLRAANVDWNGLKLDDVKEMNFTDDEAEIYRLRPGDIVLGEASGSPSEVGKPGIWHGEIEDCCFQNTLLRVRSFGPDPQYLLHFLRSEALRGAFVEHSRGVGIHHLGSARLTAWQVPVPPLAEQRRIVATLEDHLSRLDAANVLLAAAAAKMKRLPVIELLRVLKEVKADNRSLASLLRTKMINGRSVPTRPGGFPVLRLTALNEGRVDLTQRKEGAWTGAEAQPFVVHRGDFFVSRGNGSLKLVGLGGLVNNDPDPVAFPDTLIRVRVNTELVTPKYTALVWNSRLIRRQIEGAARTTAGIYKINQAILERITLPVPSISDQQRIVEHMDSVATGMARTIDMSQRALTRARQLRASLLAHAFTGRLVEQDVNDEPAAELLARTRAERGHGQPANKGRSVRTPIRAPKHGAAVDADLYEQEELPL